jgi:pseudouridylate synthase
VTNAFVVSPHVREALDTRIPVVALETSVLAQGLPHPRNLEAMDAMTHAIQARGGRAAWVFVKPGAVQVGASEADLIRLSTEGLAVKVARRDLPMAVAGGRLGATTVSAALWAAGRAGIEVMATGGIGGVHVGSTDVSADLLELARTAGTVVCSGPKSIVDPAATLERLEELGVGVLGYRCERLPFFLVRESDVRLDHYANNPAEVAMVSRTRRDLGIASALLVCNPIPPANAMEPDTVSKAVLRCVEEAERGHIRGKDVTPFLLSCLAERTGGASLDANLALLESNAALAADIAVALSGRIAKFRAKENAERVKARPRQRSARAERLPPEQRRQPTGMQEHQPPQDE